MLDKKVLYFEATEEGMAIEVQDPVAENVMGKVIDTPLGFNGSIITKYGVDYHIAFMDTSDVLNSAPTIVFEGKQDDLFYFLELKSELLSGDIKADTEQIKKLIDSGKGYFCLKWWMVNDANATDDPGINRINGKLMYFIKLTDKITLQVISEGKNASLDCIDDIIELTEHVCEGKFELRTI